MRILRIRHEYYEPLRNEKIFCHAAVSRERPVLSLSKELLPTAIALQSRPVLSLPKEAETATRQKIKKSLFTIGSNRSFFNYCLIFNILTFTIDP
jgi:hypothetical protein